MLDRLVAMCIVSHIHNLHFTNLMDNLSIITIIKYGRNSKYGIQHSDKNIYIESMSFNGKNYTKNYLEHFELLKGGVLDIKMGDEPNMNRGVSPEDFPYSFSVNEKQKK